MTRRTITLRLGDEALTLIEIALRAWQPADRINARRCRELADRLRRRRAEWGAT